VLAVDLAATVEGQPVTWQERQLVCGRWPSGAANPGARRPPAAGGGGHSPPQRAQTRQENSGGPALTAAAEQILAQQRVVGLVQLDLETTTQVIPQRRYGARPATHRAQRQSTIRRGSTAGRRRSPAAAGLASLCHQPRDPDGGDRRPGLSGQYLIERSFGRLKGRALAITPLFLQTDARVEA